MWNKDFILLFLSNFLMYITYYAIISVLPVYLVYDLHATKSQVGTVLSVYVIACVLIRPFSGFALEKFGCRTIFLSSLILYTFFYSGYLVAFSLSSLIILRFIQGFTWGVTTVSGSTIAVDIIPQNQRGEGLGYFALSTTAGMSIGPIIGLALNQRWGFETMIISGIGISLLSLICAYLIHLRKRYRVGRKIHLELSNMFGKTSILPSFNLFIIMISYGGLLSFIALFGKEMGIHNTSMYFFLLAVGIGISQVTGRKSL